MKNDVGGASYNFLRHLLLNIHSNFPEWSSSLFICVDRRTAGLVLLMVGQMVKMVNGERMISLHHIYY